MRWGEKKQETRVESAEKKWHRQKKKKNDKGKKQSLTEEEKISSLWLAVGEEGGVFGQEAVGAGLIVLPIMVWRVTIDDNCES